MTSAGAPFGLRIIRAMQPSAADGKTGECVASRSPHGEERTAPRFVKPVGAIESKPLARSVITFAGVAAATPARRRLPVSARLPHPVSWPGHVTPSGPLPREVLRENPTASSAATRVRDADASSRGYEGCEAPSRAASNEISCTSSRLRSRLVEASLTRTRHAPAGVP